MTNRKRLVYSSREAGSSHTLVTTVDEVWHRVEAAWTTVSVYAIISPLDLYMPLYLCCVLTAAKGGTDFSGSMLQTFLKI